ncbi:complement C3-like, partial [Terrapene carolina triunguis]|uniref:complement C3-like n=1 Tax=Terrapene triunguis TaxID=2587831 RepID=UPI0011565488
QLFLREDGNPALNPLPKGGFSRQPSYSLITPNVLRVESEEKVVVEAHGLNAPIAVTVTVLDFLLKQHILYQVQTNLNPANGMMGTAVIKIPTKNITKDSKQNQYVVVQAKFPQQTLEKVVLVHFHSGYIFIQTDKTIYTPGSTVLYRIFTVGHKLEPVSKGVIVEFETPESIIVKQIPISAHFKSGISSLSHNLPEIISLGTWKITARYEDSPQQTFSAQFDVREDVLPSFEVILEPSEKFLYIDGNEDFRVSITARYLYGKKLDGNAFVLFGVKMDDEKRSIPQSLKRISIEDGEGKATLTRAMLRARFANLNELVGHSLYISVTVLTESAAEDTLMPPPPQNVDDFKQFQELFKRVTLSQGIPLEEGGYKGAEPDVSLTAFVLIALEEAKDICKDQVNSLEGSISKAADYLVQRYQSLTRPYTVALASYALAMVGTLNTEKALMRASTEGNRWEEPNARNFSIEGTSYALLALLKMKKYELTGPIVRWLREQNYYGGGYGSTQATIMVFQALAQYQLDIPQHKDLNLDVSIFLSHHASLRKYRISNQNALVARTAEVPDILVIIYSHMPSIQEGSLRQFLVEAVSILAHRDLETVISSLLGEPLPMNSDIAELWRSLGGDPLLATQVLKILIDKIKTPTRQEGRITSETEIDRDLAAAEPLLATCAISEVVSALQSSKAVQELLPELFPVLLQQ